MMNVHRKTIPIFNKLKQTTSDNEEEKNTVSSSGLSHRRIQRSKNKKQEELEIKSNISSRSKRKTLQGYGIWKPDDEHIVQFLRNKKEKKRELTPCRSKKDITVHKIKAVQQENKIVNRVETDIKMRSIQTKLQNAHQKCIKFEQQIMILKNERKKLELTVKKLRSDNQKLKGTNQQLTNQKSILQNNILKVESNLESTHSNFEKLQKSIKVNQINSLKQKIDSLLTVNKQLQETVHKKSEQIRKKHQQISSLNNQYRKILLQYQQLENQKKSIEQYFERQIKQLKQPSHKIKNNTNFHPNPNNSHNNKHMISKNTTEINQQDYVCQLQNNLYKIKQSLNAVQNDYQKVSIELIYFKRKSIEEYRLCTMKKQQTINKLQKKLAVSLNQISSLKKQIGRYQANRVPPNRSLRQSIMTPDRSRKDEQFIFCLSPE